MDHPPNTVVAGLLTWALAALGATQGLALAGLLATALPGAVVVPTLFALACCALVAAVTLRWARAHSLDALSCMFGTTGLVSWGSLLAVSILPGGAAPWAAAACLPLLLMAFCGPVLRGPLNGAGFGGPLVLALASWETQGHFPGLEGPGVFFVALTIALLAGFSPFHERLRSIWTTPVWRWIRVTVDAKDWQRFVDACADTLDPTWPREHQHGLALGAPPSNTHIDPPRWEPVLVHTPSGLGWDQAEALYTAINRRFAERFPFATPPQGDPLPVEVSHSAHAVLARHAARGSPPPST
jgi:hypothetical protein